MSSSIELKKQHRHHGGWVKYFTHPSAATKTAMNFSVFIPDHEPGEKLDTLIWLSGLTCTEENFIAKAGYGKKATELRMILACPDTSPRGLDLPQEHESYDFGSGAGFYVNATTKGYSEHYKMYDYILEFRELIEKNFQTRSTGIFGHSMGGHGALVLGLRNQNLFKSISAFAPIVAPTQCPWGVKALKGYLGDNKEDWKNYDATELVQQGKFEGEILISQGTNDDFLKEQLKPEIFQKACPKNVSLKLKMEEGFDHSYYFISSFIDEHLEFHSTALKQAR